MFTINHAMITPVSADAFTEQPAGEATKIVTEGVMLHAGLATMIYQRTELTHLTSVGDRHVYSLLVLGYTIDEFIAIATAYANEDFDEATRLISELRSRGAYLD